MESIDELVSKLRELCEPGTRDKLIARGLARGMIWTKGILPPDSPNFSEELTNDLLNHGYLVLGYSLQLRTLDPSQTILDDSFRTAAEAIEAAIRKGHHSADRGFHLTVSAAAFHLAHYAARSFSLLAEERAQLNLTSGEVVLVALMQRQLNELQSICINWLNDSSHTDQGIAELLASNNITFDVTDAAYTVISHYFHRAIACFDFALRSGEQTYVDLAKALLDNCVNSSEELKHVPLWWIAILARHLIDDLWGRTLYQLIPNGSGGDDTWTKLRKNFIELLCKRSLSEVDLWPSQLPAAKRVIDESDNLVVALPTSSGKTRIAELCILKSLASGRRTIYITPLRALSAQVEFSLERTFKPLGFSVTSVYGAAGVGASDVDTMRSASIVVATPEKLDFAIRQDATVLDDVGLIVLDEGHMIGLSEREIRYEVLVQRLLKRSDASTRRIVCLSAIFTEGESFDAFTKWIRMDKEGEAIRSVWRPTRQRPATIEWQSTGGRLEYKVDSETVFVQRFVDQVLAKGRRKKDFPKDRAELIVASVDRFRRDGHAVLVYCPLRGSVEKIAETFILAHKQDYLVPFLTNVDKSKIELALRIGAEWLGMEHPAMEALRLGIAVHHGHLPRPFLTEIERLLRNRVLKVAIASPTLAQGVDLSFSVLVFNSLWRAGKLIEAKEFANVVGRVGRAFVDLDGVYVLPVHEPEVRKRRMRHGEFYRLIREAKKRELESGIFLLVYVCLSRLKDKLQLQDDQMIDYVLNQQSSIDQLAEGDNEDAEQMQVILAELDAGILALVDDLNCDATQTAALLDNALKSSLWQRRLAVRDESEQQLQTALLHARTRHIWSRTSNKERRGFFAASIGTDTGLQIVNESEGLRLLLSNATEAIKTNKTTDLVAACSGLAECLYKIHPFIPETLPNEWKIDNWSPILEAWLSGKAMYPVAESLGIAFVQEAVVYRLVWATEAVRVILESLDNNDESELTSKKEESVVALCLTYGVPTISAARLLEAGLESRLLAVRLALELGLTFNTREETKIWLEQISDFEPLEFSDAERESWNIFIIKQNTLYSTWERKNETFMYSSVENHTLELGDRVRVITKDDGTTNLYSVDCRLQGVLEVELIDSNSYTGVIISKNEIQLEYFGPLIFFKS